MVATDGNATEVDTYNGGGECESETDCFFHGICLSKADGSGVCVCDSGWGGSLCALDESTLHSDAEEEEHGFLEQENKQHEDEHWDEILAKQDEEEGPVVSELEETQFLRDLTR